MINKTSGSSYLNTLNKKEDLLSQLEEQFSETQEKCRDWIDNLAVGVFRNTPGYTGRILDVNPAMIKIFEADSKKDLLKHNVNELYKDPHKPKEISDKILKNGIVKNEEIQLKSLKERIFWASITAILTKDREGNIYFDGIVKDISERKRIEKALKDS